MTRALLFIFFLSFAPVMAQGFHQQAVEESLVPIRPGVPGKKPFLNAQAKQFIWAPAFDFKAVDGANAYRFVATGEDGVAHSFEAAEPSAPLTPIWKDLPVGATSMKVEALDAPGGKAIGVAGERQFHRATV